MAWSISLNGHTYTNADFDGQAYVDTWPTFWADMAAVASGIAAAAAAGGTFVGNVSVSAATAMLTVTDTTSYTAGVGGIVDLSFRNASSAQKIGGRIKANATTGTNGAEVADLIFYTMRAGSVVEAGRFTGAGDLTWSGVASTAYTPTITASSGTITSASATGSYKKFGRLVKGRMAITVTTNGTGAGYVQASLPFTAATLDIGAGYRAADNISVRGETGAGSNLYFIKDKDGNYPAVDGTVIRISFCYEAQS